MNWFISKIFKSSFIFTFAVLGVFILFSNQLSKIIYNDIAISKYILLMCPLGMFMSIDNVVDNMLKGLNKQVGVMICNIVDLFLSITCIFFVLPIYGVNGYILILYTSEILNLAVSMWQLYKASHFKFRIKDWILKPLIALGISTTLLNFIIIKNNSSTFTLILEIIIFVLCYLISLFIINGITKEDLDF